MQKEIVSKKTIKELIDCEYRGYAEYVIQNRAIPSYIDGLKPVQRKVLYVVKKIARKDEKKIAEIAGQLASVNYHHGDASAQDAAIRMAQKFHNNVPLITGHGNFGSRIIPQAAAARYIHATLSPEYDKYFSDEEICPDNIEPDSPEPAHYLPTIPWVLVNGATGVAVGFATNILPHSVEDVSKLCKAYVEGKNLNRYKIEPTFPLFNGPVYKAETGSWATDGVIESTTSTKFVISELPFGYSREKYINILVKMEDQGKIVSFKDYCSKKGFRFDIKVTKEQKKQAEKDLLKYFKLTTYHAENITAIDENNDLIIFNCIEDVVKKFCDYRLTMYEKKFEYEKNKCSETMSFLKAKMAFIKDVINDVINPSVMKKDELQNYVVENIISEEDIAKNIVSIPVYGITSDEVADLQRKIDELETNYQYWENVQAPEYYMEQLSKII